MTGAGGSVGVGRAVRSPPDGYTISFGHLGTHVANGAIYKLGYDLVADLEPVALLPSNPMIIVSKNAVPAKSLQEFLAWLKAQPTPPTAGTAGAGSGSHIAGLYFENVTGIKLQYVPYRGTGPAMNDLVAGQIDLIVDQTSNSIGQVRAGTIRAYAITDSRRVESASDIPTVDEAGLPGFHMTLWSGLWVPKDTPKDIVAKLNAAAVDALNDPSVRKQLENLGLQMPPKDKLDAGSARCLAEGRNREMVANDQGRQREGGLNVVSARSLIRVRPRRSCRVHLLRMDLLVSLRRHGGVAAKALAIDQQILHHPLDIVSRFGKRNALDPVDRVDLGIARIAVGLDPVPHPAPAGVVAGKGHDVRALVFAQQRAQFGGAHLRVVDRVGNHPVPVIADAEALGGIASRFRRHLHQADRIRRRLVALVERAFGARHRIDDAALDLGSELAVRRNPDGRERVMVERQPAAERGFSDLQHRAGIVAAAGEFAERFERRYVGALFAEIGGKIEHDIALADLVEHLGGAHAFVGGRRIGGRRARARARAVRSGRRPSLARASCP